MLFQGLDVSARVAGVTAVSIMGSFDGFGDALAYVTAKEQTDR
ncbi:MULTISPECIES: hypothetical protein [Bradyrhizobium]|nr:MULTISPECIES: hypothetical protein [Bradyrhizobium]